MYKNFVCNLWSCPSFSCTCDVNHVILFVWYCIKTKKIDFVLIPYGVLLFLLGEASAISL